MSTKLTHRITLYIPATHQTENGSDLLRIALADVTKVAGGCTCTSTMGYWYDGTGKKHADQINKVEWWYTADKDQRMHDETQRVINELHRLGEECVMGEKLCPTKGHRAHLMFK